MDNKRTDLAFAHARVSWIVRPVCSGPLYCAVLVFAAWADSRSILGWQGFLHRPPPVPEYVLMVVLGLLTPLYIRSCRAKARRPRRMVMTPKPSGGERERALVTGYLKAQLLFAGMAEVPVWVCVALAALFGTLPLLWIVAGEYTFMMILYMPKRSQVPGLGEPQPSTTNQEPETKN